MNYIQRYFGIVLLALVVFISAYFMLQNSVGEGAISNPGNHVELPIISNDGQTNGSSDNFGAKGAISSGRWISDLDQQSIMVIDGNRYSESYDGVELDQGTVEARAGDSDGLHPEGVGQVVFTSDQDQETREFVIIALSDQSLEMVLVGGAGQVQRFSRAIGVGVDSTVIAAESSREVPADVRTQEYLGLTVFEAEQLAESQGVPFRIVVLDGRPLAVTMDFRPGRINAEVQESIVTAYTIE